MLAKSNFQRSSYPSALKRARQVPRLWIEKILLLTTKHFEGIIYLLCSFPTKPRSGQMIKITTELVTNASRGEDESRVTLDSLSYTFLRAFPHLLEISRACCAHSPSYHAVGPITIFYQCVGYGSDQSERSVVV
jgi:hypothetical protein